MRLPAPRIAAAPDVATPQEFLAGFSRLRTELKIPEQHSDAALAEVSDAIAAGPTLPPEAGATEIADRSDLDLVAIDPPGSKDLDQAYFARRTDSGYEVSYAIADVAAYVEPGGALDSESRARGVTYYSPDRRCSLYPEALSEGAASLLQSADRQSLLWTINLDHDGALVDARIERARVRVRAAISYRMVQDQLDAGSASEPIALLAEIGKLRQEREQERGGVSLNLPGQEVVTDGDSFKLSYDQSLPVEGFNAQISLLTGIAAAGLMVETGTGLLRTLPPPDRDVVAELRTQAGVLGVDWPEAMAYPEFIRGLDPARSAEIALLNSSTGVLRGAGYLAFVDETPHRAEHHAIASVYAHVTAPLRRMADRYVNEILLAICAERPLPEWSVAALAELPSELDRARSRESSLERATVDWVEAVTLRHRVGETFDGVIIRRLDDDHVRVQLKDPAVVAKVDSKNAEAGSDVQLTLAEANPQHRRVVFEL